MYLFLYFYRFKPSEPALNGGSLPIIAISADGDYKVDGARLSQNPRAFLQRGIPSEPDEFIGALSPIR